MKKMCFKLERPLGGGGGAPPTVTMIVLLKIVFASSVACTVRRSVPVGIATWRSIQDWFEVLGGTAVPFTNTWINLIVCPVSVAPAFTCTGEVRPVALLAGVQIVTDGLAVFKVQVACAFARGANIAAAATTRINFDMFTRE